MNDLAQDKIAKPKSDDMSMDEILASIRKIISSDDEKRHNSKYVENAYTPDHKQNTSETHKKQETLSAREQLLSLTRPDLYDSDIRPQRPSHKVVQSSFDKQNDKSDKTMYDNSFKAKTYYQKLNQAPETNFDDDNNSETAQNDHDEEILRALNEIRNSLSLARTHTDASHTHYDKIPTTQDDTRKKPYQDTHIPASGKIIDATVNSAVEEIDLKPAQFTGDAVPEFLKKFKKQQQVMRDKPQSDNQQTNYMNYDFSKIPTFDEQNDVVTLTEKIMPTTQEELLRQEQAEYSKSTVKNNFSKLRKNTEEIMKRAKERAYDEDDELSQEDSPMANMIMRTLQPMLQEWIDENMQLIAEQVLRDEFRRGLK